MNRTFLILGAVWLLIAALGVSQIPHWGLGVALMPGFMGAVFMVLGVSGGNP